MPNELDEKRFSNVRLLPDYWEQYAESAIFEAASHSLVFDGRKISQLAAVELQKLAESSNAMIRLASSCRLIKEGLLNKKNIASQMQRCQNSQEASVLALLYLDHVENDISSWFEALKQNGPCRKNLLDGAAVASLVCAKEDPRADVAFGAALRYRKKNSVFGISESEIKTLRQLRDYLMQYKAYKIGFGIIDNLSDIEVQNERNSNSTLFQSLTLLRIFPPDIKNK